MQLNSAAILIIRSIIIDTDGESARQIQQK